MRGRRWWERILAVACALVLCFFGGGLLLGGSEPFSETENRAMRSWNTLWANGVGEEGLLRSLSGICADQFPLRGELLTLRAYGERLLGRGEHRRILFGEDGYLIPRGEYGEDSYLEANAEAIRRFCETREELTLWILPQSRDVMCDSLPKLYPQEEQGAQRVAESLSDSFALTRNAMRQRAEEGEQVWYRTDHHFTTLGAYECYRVLSPTVGWKPMAEEWFRKEVVSTSFLGSSHSSLGGKYPCQSDTIVLYRYPEDEEITVENRETKTVVKGFYDRSRLDMKDQYQIFLGGNHPYVSITAPSLEARPRYLVVKDSFANSMIPFLAIHADLDVIDPRYTSLPLSSYMEEREYDGILFIAGVGTLATDPSFGRFLR